nr:ribonuclease H-like domain-containing protein [Tanacetum cinerariifolium]
MNACLLCGSFDHNKRRCSKRFEDQEQVMKAGKKINFDKKESVRFNKKKVRCYKCQQRGHFARECKTNGGNDKQRYSSFKIKEIGKKKEDSKALITVDTLVDWTDHDEEASTADDAGEFALMGVTSELTLEDKIRVLSIELENTSNLLKHSERINTDIETAKKELQTKLDNHLVQTEKWRISSKNLFRLIDSSMSVRTKVGLGFNTYIRENELGRDDSAFSVFTTNSEDVEGRPLFNRFAKADSMKVVPPPLSGDYTSLSDHIDLDESQMSYVTSLHRSTQMTLLPVILVSNLQSPSQMILPHVHQLSVNKVNHQNQFVPQAVLLRTGKVNIPPARPQPVPIGKPKVFAPVPTGRQNMPFPVSTDRGYSPSENPFPDAKDEGVFDSGCSRSMTGNKERLDDFQVFQGGKVTFGGGEDL